VCVCVCVCVLWCLGCEVMHEVVGMLGYGRVMMR
jgi:hypothetical protein